MHPQSPYPPQQPPHGGPRPSSAYPQQRHDQQPYGQGYYQHVPPPVGPPMKSARRRRVWPWVLIIVVMLPVAFFVGCAALVGGAVDSVQAQRAGGTVKIGETFTYPSGLALSVSALTPYRSSNPYIVAKDEAAYQGTVTVVNGTKKNVGSALLTINATVGNAAAERMFDGLSLSSADIPPGQRLDVPFQFKTKKTAKGDLRISVTAELNEAVFFTGKL